MPVFLLYIEYKRMWYTQFMEIGDILWNQFLLIIPSKVAAWRALFKLVFILCIVCDLSAGHIDQVIWVSHSANLRN